MQTVETALIAVRFVRNHSREGIPGHSIHLATQLTEKVMFCNDTGAPASLESTLALKYLSCLLLRAQRSAEPVIAVSA
jgi:hypothetical protein